MIAFIRNNRLLALFIFIPIHLILYTLACLNNKTDILNISFGPLLDLLYWIMFEGLSMQYWVIYVLQYGLLLYQAVLVNNIFKSQFINQQHWMIFIVYLLLNMVCQTSSLGLGWHLSITILIYIVQILIKISQGKNVYKELFDVCFLAGLSIFLVPSFIIFLPFVWIVLLRQRSYKINEFAIAFIGLIIPSVWYLSYIYVFDVSINMYAYIENYIGELSSLPFIGYDDFVFFAILVYISLSSIFNIQTNFSRSSVKNRNFFILQFWLLLFSVLGFFLITEKDKVGAMALSIPLTFIISFQLINIKRVLVADVFLTLLFLASIERQLNFL